MLNVASDPHCCGVTHIGNFGDAAHKTDIKQHRGANRCVLATVIQSQKAAKAALEEAGFELLKEFEGNTGNTIYLYGKFNRR